MSYECGSHLWDLHLSVEWEFPISLACATDAQNAEACMCGSIHLFQWEFQQSLAPLLGCTRNGESHTGAVTSPFCANMAQVSTGGRETPALKKGVGPRGGSCRYQTFKEYPVNMPKILEYN